MTLRAASLWAATLASTALGCNAILGIDDHGVAPEGGAEAATEASSADDGSGSASTTGDAASSSSGGQPGAMDATSADAASAEAASADAMGGDATVPDATTGMTPDAATDAHDAMADAGVQHTPEAGCDGLCTVGGPAMVPVTSFYVDSTEVTIDEYDQFLAAKGSDTSGQPAACSWNTSYMPTGGTNQGNLPRTYVDWCDAYAFCKWAGKRLCGTIGSGAPIASSSLLNQNLSQWFLACGGPNGSPDVNNAPMCNATMGTSGLVAVSSLSGCQGWYTGLFDMTGNAAEWVDSCDIEGGGAGGASDTCYIMGGSYVSETAYCTGYDGLARNTTADPIGFRCCHE